MNDILALARYNQDKAWEVIKETNIIKCWQSIGARINLIGSLKTGLLMTHRDIDFHVYTPTMSITDSFKAMARLAENPRVRNITYTNLLHTEEECIEWHAWCLNKEDELWQIDMVHIVEGSRYDGYFENVTDRIAEVLTPELKEAILTLKYETPEDEKIMGIEYYVAVIRDGVRNYPDFTAWRKANPISHIVEWMP